MQTNHSKTRFYIVLLSVMFSVCAIVGTVSAVTTISTNISTAGTLSVTGLSTLANASTTGISSTGNLWLNGYATTTASTGDIATQGMLTVTGLTTLGNASTSILSNSGTFSVNGNATTTPAGNISTQGTVTIGSTGRAVSNMVFGYCTITNSSSITASSSAYFNCTTDTSGNLSATHRIFIQATSSLPTFLSVRAASSTNPNTIQLEIVNLGYTGSAVAPGSISVNYFGVK